MYGLVIFVGLYLAGYALNGWLGIPLPPGVIGLLLLLACLFAGRIDIRRLEATSGFMMEHFSLLFAPVIVSGLFYLFHHAEGAGALIASLAVSAAAAIAATGWAASKLLDSGKEDGS